MTKLKIGTRVRDNDGDEGVIVGKSKGYRDVKYETGGCEGLTVKALLKGFLTPIPANDNVSATEDARPAVCEIEYKVGDRVRAKADWLSIKAGEEYPVKGVFGDGSGVWLLDETEGAMLKSEVEPVVAPATTAATTPAEWVPAVGDRVRVTGARLDHKEKYIGTEFVISEQCYDIDNQPSFTGKDVGSYVWTATELTPAPLPVAEQPGGGEVVAAWAPKVGERVRYSGKSTQYRDAYMVGALGTVRAVRVYGVDVKWDDEYFGGGRTGGDKYVENLEPLLAPPTTWAPVAGKFGKTRDGRKVGPIEARSSEEHPFKGQADFHEPAQVSTAVWTAEGVNYEYRWLDLISEWIEPTVEPATPAPIAVAEATATPAPLKVGDRVISSGNTSTKYKVEAIDGESVSVRVVEKDGTESHLFEYQRLDIFSLDPAITPPTPEPKFKVGDRVEIVSSPYLGRGRTAGQTGQVVAVVDDGKRGRIKVKCSCGEWSFHDGELKLIESSHPIGSTVTFTATGRLSAINENGHYQVTFPGLEPGQNSFALPSKYVALAN